MGSDASKPLEEATRNAVREGGKLMVSGRYHKLPKRVEDDYSVDTKVLGSGYNGSVHLARSKHGGGKKYAIKAFKLNGLPKDKREELENETEIFLRMDHPHIVRLVDAYEAETQLALVMECMEGGELYDRVRSRKRFSEKEAQVAVWQMLLAVNYLHQQGIAHRDLKLENFLYESKDSDHLKLIDFGFSKVWQVNTKMRNACGTLAYVAPEVLNKSYTPQCDMWSLGVITWILLVGYMPFGGSDKEQVAAIKKGQPLIKQDRWRTVTKPAKDFVDSLLKLDPKERLTAEKALEHEWVKAEGEHHPEVMSDEAMGQALENFAKQSQFKRACLSVMAWSLSNEERKQVRDVFIALDTENRGTIKLSDLQKVMEAQFEMSDTAAAEIAHVLDSSGDDELNYSEFLAAMVSTRIAIHDDLLLSTFRRFDVDKSGYITVQDLKAVLGESFDGAKVEELIKEADVSGDGRISQEEFFAYLKENSAEATQSDAHKLIDDHIQKLENFFESPFRLRARTKQAVKNLKDLVTGAA